jgi:hypothetical protein
MPACVGSARSRRTSSMHTPQTTTSLTGTLFCAGPRRPRLRAGCTMAASSSPHSTRTSRPSSCSCARPGASRLARRSASASPSTTRSSGSRAGTSAQVGLATCALPAGTASAPHQSLRLSSAQHQHRIMGSGRPCRLGSGRPIGAALSVGRCCACLSPHCPGRDRKAASDCGHADWQR